MGVKRFGLVVITDFRESLRDRGLEAEESGNIACQPDPDDSGAQRVGEAAEAGEFDGKRLGATAGGLDLGDCVRNVSDGNVAEEAEGEVNMFGLGPADVAAGGSCAELILNRSQRGQHFQAGGECNKGADGWGIGVGLGL
jgi:hypothetical protein